ncbi:hypothetical protein A2911_01020 [Candidatus Nomurabacteria bacterium RIFCSPLOWO2_01_FULL_40_15]|uniref:Thioredoxin domain-containing protein n=1 Tax=Candidatus Nomurabacteria bacterium RIFCSPLOWO2_01_FULL_40_15 TaxID=1801772 RepID=A0A1F6X4Y7_9BACT|nr:MAG: hypothetical protein A2911_01020 [Candidatus Nomurabacteria bacterium RIFCSPLOWO2_01_FULL_40_15]
MNQKVTIGVLVVLVIVGGIFLISNNSEEKKLSETDTMMTAEDEGAMMEKGSVTVVMSALNGSGEVGRVVLSDAGGKTKVVVEISGGAIDIPQPSHIHMGESTTPGAILYPLSSVVNGKAETILDVSLETLGTKLPLAVMVHKSKEEIKTFVSGGNLPKDGFGAMMNSGDTMTKKEDEAMMKEGDGAMMAKYTGTVLAGKSAPVLDYNKADYDMAIASDKLVVLYFYANWCPICKEEVANALFPAFDELTTDNVVGIRINYKDSNTDKDEESLARKYGIPYQHTKVFIKNGKQILKAPDGWDKARYLTEINKALAQ